MISHIMLYCLQLNSDPSSGIDNRTDQVKMATEAGSPRRLGLNLNLSVQPHAYHWPHSTVVDGSPTRSNGGGTDEEDDRDAMMDDDDDCRQDEDCTPEEEQDILEMQVS